jgi:O-antigen/teichoic acid export membrane protein
LWVSSVSYTRPDFANRIFTIRAISSTIIFTGCIALIFFLPYSQEAKLGTLILGVTTLLTTVGQGFDILFQVKLRLDIPTYTDLASRIFVLAGIALIFVLSGRYKLDSQTLYYAVIGVIAASYIIGFGGRWLGARRMIPLRLALDPDLARALLRPAIPIFVVAILCQIHYKADAIILSLLRPATDVAI